MNTDMMFLSFSISRLPQPYRFNQGRGHWRTPVVPPLKDPLERCNDK
ncbi:hypothetical protein [Photobacterium sanctipauli]|nr:hypothetical protein [Photobacterium sanctipauli]